MGAGLLPLLLLPDPVRPFAATPTVTRCNAALLPLIHNLHIDAVLDGAWQRAACGRGRSGPRPVPDLAPYTTQPPWAWRMMLVRWPPRLSPAPRSRQEKSYI